MQPEIVFCFGFAKMFTSSFFCFHECFIWEICVPRMPLDTASRSRFLGEIPAEKVHGNLESCLG